ncbi:MAG: antibiotic biosynthesis monooxygenase [Acetobacteraceae bacterium]|nr:antibiotic biosynthesis monooxygenase [Acetobacteraceae bacterium]
MDGFVILAEFDLHSGAAADFLRHVGDNASASVRDEPGCRRFDVLVPEAEAQGETPRIVLYEIYDSPECFDAHLRTPHYRRFEEATRALVSGRSVRRLGLNEHAKRG